MKFLTRNTTQSPFYTRPSVTLWDRRLTWLRWLGYLTCLIIVLQTSSYLFGYPETNIIQAVYAALHRPILRPCQYHGTVGVWDKVAGDDSPAPDALGMAHDRRCVPILSTLRVYCPGGIKIMLKMILILETSDSMRAAP